MSDYLSSVANSGQVNTPPGSYHTIKEWIGNSFMDSQSRVLEIGCSTGFITIEMARYVKAQCQGLDLHGGSIAQANRNIDPHIAGRVSFLQGDAGQLPFSDGRFSHVVVSGHLPFIPASLRRPHVTEAIRVVEAWGYLLVALYFYKIPPPAALVAEFNQEIGTDLSPEHDLAYWDSLFQNQNLSLEYNSTYDIIPADAQRSQEYIAQLKGDSTKDWEKYVRLFNANGRHLGYFVRVYRKIPDERGLMIQEPRGGIYRWRSLGSKSM